MKARRRELKSFISSEFQRAAAGSEDDEKAGKEEEHQAETEAERRQKEEAVSLGAL